MRHCINTKVDTSVQLLFGPIIFAPLATSVARGFDVLIRPCGEGGDFVLPQISDSAKAEGRRKGDGNPCGKLFPLSSVFFLSLLFQLPPTFFLLLKPRSHFPLSTHSQRPKKIKRRKFQKKGGEALLTATSPLASPKGLNWTDCSKTETLRRH